MNEAQSFIHRFVPAQNSKRTLLILHGTGGNENDLLPIGRMLDPESALLSPRGKVLENGAPRFFRRIREGVFDEEDVILRANELADFVTGAVKENSLDASQIIAVGYSNGANIASAMMLLRPEILRGAILLRGQIPLIPEKLLDLTGKSVFLSSGNFDPIVDANGANELAQLLTKAGAAVTHVWQQSGHELSRNDIDAAREWLKSLAG
ncbi:MAG TPA: alpha/beta hydrolase [Alloacidobacterium sp.]|nr:alpha/beta hydrolase [Alloacidobacterium sp.]